MSIIRLLVHVDNNWANDMSYNLIIRTRVGEKSKKTDKAQHLISSRARHGHHSRGESVQAGLKQERGVQHDHFLSSPPVGFRVLAIQCGLVTRQARLDAREPQAC
eukprot:4214213-Pyramimonas_sp.AAC.1